MGPYMLNHYSYMLLSRFEEGLQTLKGKSAGPDKLLLRKEVIQPHLPVRLPCYDFTPLARHTFGTLR